MDYDNEIIADFLGEYSDAQIEAEKVLNLWDEFNDSHDSINTLFRVIHSIKGNFRMMYLAQLSETIHALENILSQLRENKRQLINGLTILISTTLEQCKQFSMHIFAGRDRSSEIKALTYVLIDLSKTSNHDFASALRYALQTIDEINEYGNDYSPQRLFDFLEQEEITKSVRPIAYVHNHAVKNQLQFFKQLITQVESFFPMWRNRSQRILTLVSYMNASLNHPVNPTQLEAAVYLHDIGMSFISPQILYHTKNFSNNDRKLMQVHTETGYQWLSMIPGWEEAAMIIQQHHERFDGTGYPLGLSSTEICEGAKLLAIGDAYASITNQEKTDSEKKSLMHALMEIDEGTSQQFDPKWVKTFNQAIEVLEL